MKVVIASVFPPFRGGIAQFNKLLAAALRADGHDVHLVGFSRQYPSWLFPGKSQYGTEVMGEDVPLLIDSINPLTWRKAAKHINNLGADQVIVPYWSAYLSPALTGMIRHIKGVKVRGLLHNALPHDAGSVQKLLSKRFISRCDGLICLSESVARDALQLAPKIDAGDVTVLFHPVYSDLGIATSREDARKSLGFDDERRVLLFFGLIRPYKGLDVLLEAFNQLDEQYNLIVAGEPYMSLEALKRIPDSSASKRILWDNRFLSAEDIQLYFGAADLVVLPYKNATQSGVTAIAMHFGMPVIASDVGGLSEYIDRGVTGDVFTANNAISLSLAIESWFSSARCANRSLAEVRQGVKESIEKKAASLSWRTFAAKMMEST